MPKEYRTIQEVAGPLMMVKGVENVAFDELGEIELYYTRDLSFRIEKMYEPQFANLIDSTWQVIRHELGE